ncbi:FeoC-like transcriptional regulator [Vibrio sp. ZSDE26]|uniref:FeoC-like transcriptional regulator n=1 Tax=Vibrio amylolyticus TaxID=2847292 RepID=A0A9X1XGI5_9VIBR|nr:FeoC-like transcriptional regulator [Vibrio amylolyticus]MCK6262667.1 FeoC-like transcriptional regulator [Vibrio amylolyticus]
MILSDLIEYIEVQGTSSRKDLAKQFALSEDGVDAMLGVWIKKGKISRINDTNKLGHTTRVRYCSNRNEGFSMMVTM